MLKRAADRDLQRLQHQLENHRHGPGRRGYRAVRVVGRLNAGASAGSDGFDSKCLLNATCPQGASLISSHASQPSSLRSHSTLSRIDGVDSNDRSSERPQIQTSEDATDRSKQSPYRTSCTTENIGGYRTMGLKWSDGWRPVGWSCRATPVPCSSPMASRDRFPVNAVQAKHHAARRDTASATGRQAQR